MAGRAERAALCPGPRRRRADGWRAPSRPRCERKFIVMALRSDLDMLPSRSCGSRRHLVQLGVGRLRLCRCVHGRLAARSYILAFSARAVRDSALHAVALPLCGAVWLARRRDFAVSGSTGVSLLL